MFKLPNDIVVYEKLFMAPRLGLTNLRHNRDTVQRCNTLTFKVSFSPLSISALNQMHSLTTLRGLLASSCTYCVFEFPSWILSSYLRTHSKFQRVLSLRAS